MLHLLTDRGEVGVDRCVHGGGHVAGRREGELKVVGGCLLILNLIPMTKRKCVDEVGGGRGSRGGLVLQSFSDRIGIFRGVGTEEGGKLKDG